MFADYHMKIRINKVRHKSIINLLHVTDMTNLQTFNDHDIEKRQVFLMYFCTTKYGTIYITAKYFRIIINQYLQEFQATSTYLFQIT
jgi:hypothetical protein